MQDSPCDSIGKGVMLNSGDVRLLGVTQSVPIRTTQVIKLDRNIGLALSSYIPPAILSKMSNFADTWSRTRRESGK